MISVMNNDFEINRSPNANSTPDLSFSIDSPSENQISNDQPTESQDLVESRVSNRISTGDMVWGKVKSHPWWPGHIFHEKFASSSVRRMKSEDFFLVAFFGDSSYGWFDPSELIPYEVNLVEKSKQTTQKSFIKALDESIDEMSRRAALSISCRCRNPNNFRLARVPNYFEVDVAGYERNGIYSKKQIAKEREGFEPWDVVTFLKKLAVVRRGGETKDADWHRNIAVGLALRRARFEEFDETYAQAFGQEPVRPTRDEMGVLGQAGRFAPRVAPLSGPLVIAEALGATKSRSSSSITKRSSSYSSSSKSKPKEKSTYKKQHKDSFVLKRREDHHHISPPPPPPSYSSAPTTSEYVLQKREPPPVQDTKPIDQKPIIDEEEEEASPQTPPLPSSSENIIAEKPTVPPLDAIKKEKKRPLDDKQEATITKKKKNLEPSEPSPPPINPDELTHLRLPNIITDMKSLALDPYFAIERNWPSIARHIFTRFRNLIYMKSLLPPLPDEPHPTPKLFKRPDDPTKSGRKRPPSDRQEEKSEKRIKKITTLKKSMAPPPAPEPEKKKPEAVVPLPPLLPLPPTPTYLIMKFPPRSPLPSVSNLKARFARFGPLDVGSIRVFWKTHTCKVLYKHKADALKAYTFAKSNDLLGQLQVDYSIREAEPAPAPAAAPEPHRAEPARLKSILKKPGGGGDEAAKENRVKFMLSKKDNDNKVDSRRKSPPPKGSVAAPSRSLDPRQLPKKKVDVSHQMLSLLLRCNDIVAGLKSLPGFVPYRPL